MALKATPIGKKQNPKAERIFTDRVEPKEAFLSALENLNQNDYSVLTFYGLGGIGKTGLKEHLCSVVNNDERLKNKVIYSFVDFLKDKYSLQGEFYRILADRFSKQFHIKFTAFSLAYLIYLKKANPNLELKKQTLPFLEEGDIISDAVKFLSENAGAIASFATKFTGYLYKKFSNIIGIELSLELEKLEADETTLYEIEQELPRFFAYDLDKFKEKNPDKKVAIFFYTYEICAKKQPNDADTLKQDEWVRNFIAQNPKILFVIGGREKLVWDLDDDWKEVLTQFRLKELSDDDCRYFLNHCGITNKKIQDNIIKSSYGVPFYLDMCVEIWENDKNMESFENIKQHDITERLLRYLDKNERATLELLSLTNYFDKEIFKLIIDSFSTGYPATMIDELTKFSFISKNDDKYYIQRLMKECLKNQCNDDLKKDVNKLLFDFFENKLENLSVKTASGYYIEFIQEAFYHKENFDGIENAISWLLDKFEIYNKANLLFYCIHILVKLLDKNIEKYQLFDIFNALGMAYNSICDYNNSLEFYNKALKITDQKISEINYVAIYTNMGNSYCGLGKYNEAIEYHQKALEINRNTFGDNHPDIAVYYNNLGFCYGDICEYDKAIEYHQKALEIDKNTFGENHPDIAVDYNNLGTCYNGIGEHNKAIEYHQKALEINKNIFGKNHTNIAMNYNNIGVCYSDIGEYNKAIEYHQKALEIKKNIFGKNHTNIAVNYNNLGTCYNDIGEYSKAIKCHQKALEINKNTFGENHPNVAISYGNIGVCYSDIGEYDKAIECHQKALEIFKNTFGENHPNVATSYSNIGVCYSDIGEYDKAIECHQKALEIKKNIFGKNHPNVATSYDQLGNCYSDIEKYDKAIEYYQKALEIRKNIFGENDSNTATSYGDLGISYCLLNNFDKGEKYLLKASEIYENVLGHNDIKTAISYDMLSAFYDNNGQIDKAIEYITEAFNISLSVLGKENEQTKDLENRLSLLKRKLKMGL
ncbi:MAG: tetratricopeptide repeat protein [Campylobacter sp.]|nr:tetratricopeptide repeat protein [Campylobacter sp.]